MDRPGCGGGSHLLSWQHGVVLGTWASAMYSQNSLLRVGHNFAADYLSRGMVFPAQGLVQRADYRPRLIWEHVPHAPAAVICRHGVQPLAMGDASMNGMGVMFDLTLMFNHHLTWHTDNLSMYREYVNDTVSEYIDDTMRKSSENGSDGSEGSLERID